MTNPRGGRRIEADPMKRGSLVRDCDGDYWRRGTRIWACTARVDGGRIRNAARLPWGELLRRYGPLELVNEGVVL